MKPSGCHDLLFIDHTTGEPHEIAGNLMATSYRKFMDLLDHLANHGVYKMLGMAISTVAIGIGVSMYITPQVYIDAYSFRRVFEFASPYAWGTVYIFTALLVLITVYTNPKSAQAPAFVMAATFAAQGLLTIPMIAEGGVPSSLFTYIGMGWVCIITQLVCGARREPHDQAAVRY